MGLSCVVEYNGDVYLDGQYVSDTEDDFLWGWTHGAYLAHDYDPFGWIHEGDEDPVYPTHQQGINKRIAYHSGGRCNCEYCRRYHHHTDHGYRQRGPAQVWEAHGFRYEGYGPTHTRLVGAHQCWKKHRPYQAHGRERLPRRVDLVDLFNGLYPAR